MAARSATVDRHDPPVQTAVTPRANGQAGNCDGDYENDNKRAYAHLVNPQSLIGIIQSVSLESANRIERASQQ